MFKKPQSTKTTIFCNRISFEYHGIEHSDLSSGSLNVIGILQKSGYSAYLVGGGIRDLLLGKHPKDFDVATNAKPNEIQRLFRKSRIIGRRFQIVHVRMGSEIIEVATFRGSADNSRHQQVNAAGMLVRDNVFGTVEDDALRRDFTMNALYYNPSRHEILDFIGGYDDLEDGVIRMIGDSEQRYREDPVRMLRAVRFVGKLGLQLDTRTAEPIYRLSTLIQDVSPSRLFDEIIKLLQAGHGSSTFSELLKYDLIRPMFPQIAEILENDDYYYRNMIHLALRNTDIRLTEGKSVTPAFLYAVLLWPRVHLRWVELSTEGHGRSQALNLAMFETLDFSQNFVSIPKRFSTTMREIWSLQIKLEKRFGKRPSSTLAHPRFRAGYDFLLLRGASGEACEELGSWWTKYQDSDELQRRVLIRSVEANKKKVRNETGERSRTKSLG